VREVLGGKRTKVSVRIETPDDYGCHRMNVGRQREKGWGAGPGARYWGCVRRMLTDEKVREWKVQDGVGTESDREKGVGRHPAQG